jgi:NAD(P)H-dependent FMN reductase
MTLSGINDKKPYKVGVVIGSQRQPRAGPQIAGFVLDTIKSHLTHSQLGGSDLETVFELIDVAAQNLPLFDEPGIPSQIKESSGYAHDHTRAWSATISACDAFVFVTPQYNWGIPAGLKNAIDYLFHEWSGKPAMIVSYGGHGGDKCAAALKIVLGGGIGMKVVETTVNLSFPDRDVLVRATRGQELGLGGDAQGIWAQERDEIIKVWDEMARSFQ